MFTTVNTARPGPEAATSDGEEQTEGESHPHRLRRIIDLRKKIALIPEAGVKSQTEEAQSGFNAISWSGPLTNHEPDMRVVCGAKDPGSNLSKDTNNSELKGGVKWWISGTIDITNDW